MKSELYSLPCKLLGAGLFIDAAPLTAHMDPGPAMWVRILIYCVAFGCFDLMSYIKSKYKDEI